MPTSLAFSAGVSGTMKKVAVVVCLLTLTVADCRGISFRLEPEIRKCVKEEVHKDVLVVGEYRLSDMEGQRTDLVVGYPTCSGPVRASCDSRQKQKPYVLVNAHLLLQVADSKGHTLFRKESATKGRFAFTTEDYDMFEVCFYSIVTGEHGSLMG